jgi:subtilisin family serine protease
MQPRIVSLLAVLALASLVHAAQVNLPATRVDAIKKIHPSLLEPGVEVSAVVRLADPPLVAKVGKNAKITGLKMNRSEQKAYVAQLRQKQNVIIRKVVGAGGTVAGRMTKSLNAVLVTVKSDHLKEIAQLDSVYTIRPVANYQQDLSETVPYIGATALQAAGVTGAGIRVAVLDTGVDYTHKNLGGPGTLAAYEAAYGVDPSDPANTVRDGLFPTSKVVGGWDFLGEEWPLGPDGFDGPIAPDEDPIDFNGHGTHVADIIAGASTDGTHKGVAPDASLYAFKVCSAVATSCNGFSILLALEATLSPDHPVDYPYIDKPVDIINMSLGSPYGQIQDDSSYIVELLGEFGITVVVAAGNSGDLPYIVGSPSVAPTAISVAQTQVPSAKAYSIRVFKNGNRVTSQILNTAEIDWAPVNTTVSGPLVYVGRGCVGDPYLVSEASVKDSIAIIDRGSCTISGKIDRAARLGAKGVIIVNNVPGDPPSFSRGEGSLFVPTLVVSQADGNALKASLAGNTVRATFGPSLFKTLAGSMVSTSSRGPSYSFQTIKPEIGAPGASVSADVGTGTGQSAFGGTSGATPMVAGAAALVQSYFLGSGGFTLDSWAVKALLMNHSETNILINPVSLPGVLAPITRIGAGEVRVDRAVAGTAIAVAVGDPIEADGPPDVQGSLSFGYQAVIKPGPVSFTKSVVVYNLTSDDQVFTLTSSFRYADDAALGAAVISFSSPTVAVPGDGYGSVDVTLTLDPSKLATWQLNGGTQGANGDLLRIQEIDGYITLTAGAETLRMPWHVLPRKAADLAVNTPDVALSGGSGEFGLANLNGAVDGTSEIFMLGGTSPLDYPKPDAFGANQALPDLKAAGIRANGAALEIAIATYEERSHSSYPAEFDVYLDVNDDGVEDWVLYNFDSNGNTRVGVVDLASGTQIGSVAADVDLDSATCIYRVPLAALGLTGSSVVNWYALAFDNYFTGAFTDVIAGPGGGYLRHTLDKPRYTVAGSQTQILPSGTSTVLSVSEPAANAGASPSQDGFLLLERNAQPGRWSDVINVSESP